MAETETFQHYEVLKNPDGTFCELGRGAMGVTYKAFDTSLRSLVALKVINAAFLDSDVARQRFQREARAAAGLRHPNVAGVFHLGEEGGNFFYAMEFIEGETLEAFVRRRGPLPAALALGLTLQVVRALRAAAKVGLVHRDIKPANLMLSREDEDDTDEELHVKVIDFGLAKILRADGAEASASITGSAIVGTPHYISPEQLEEKPLDTRSDIYSLGVTLWYMLTGKPPYSGSLMQVMSKHLNELPPFEQLEAQPPAVRGLLRHMLEKDAARRPQTPSELRREIEDALRTLGAVPSLSDTAVPPTDDGTDSAPLSVTPAARPPVRGLVIEPPPKREASAPETTSAPIHIITHELPHRGAPAVPMHKAPRPRGGAGSRIALIAGAAILLLAAGSFAAWQRMSAPRTTAGLASRAAPVQAVKPTAAASAAAAANTPPMTAPVAARSSLKQALAAAKALADAGAADDALLAYTRVLDDFPDSEAARQGAEEAIVTLRSTQNIPMDIRHPLPAAEQARFDKVRVAVERAADAGFDPARLYLGDHLILTDSSVAIDWFTKAAQHGQPEAMHQLGNMYSREFGTGTETANYAHWFQDASDRGYPRSKIWLADCYSRGRGGVTQDYNKAFKLLKEAEQSEPYNPKLLVNLGVAYAQGFGTPPDPGKAFVLMQHATEQDYPTAWGDLGNFYMNGTGVEKDPSKAVECYKRGAELKDPPSLFDYALCLEKSLGTPRNLPAALDMMRQAMEAGHRDAVGYLGSYYMAGYGLDKPDPDKAAALYKQGADRQDRLCQFRYAECLENGMGVPVDKDLAAKFYLASAEKGYGPAKEWVEQHKAARGKK